MRDASLALPPAPAKPLDMLRAPSIFVLAITLAACGRMGDLRPPEGQSLPVRPAAAAETPDAGDLLTPPPYARPERVDELVKRSTPREPDRYDLPPPEGGAAPAPDRITNIDDEGAQESDTTGPPPTIEEDDE